MMGKKIAIIGSGVSGLSTLWTLRNTDHEVHVFEKDDRWGGHINTAAFTHNGTCTSVDTGFIVLNAATYPNFISFLSALNIKINPTAMTFGVSRDNGSFEWSGTSLSSIFAQRENILRPRFWRMIFDIIRFNQFALDLISDPTQPPATNSAKELTIGDYLAQYGYSDAFRDDYLIPMTACVWSTGPEKCALEFPAVTLVRFMWNHHLLTSISERPPWLTVEGGAQRYIDAVVKACPSANIHLGTPAKSIIRTEGKVRLSFGGKREGHDEEFDEVVLACHGNQALRIVGQSATLEQKEILGAFETTSNIAYLHSDLSLMPQRRLAWSAWNFLTNSASRTSSTPGESDTVCLTYNMNILQAIPTSQFGDVLVTLNPPHPPLPELTQGIYHYNHPLYNTRVISAQEELEKIQGKDGIWYAGAWTGYGFHEDGFASGMRVGLSLGGDVTWAAKNAKFSRGEKPMLGWKDYLARGMILVVQLLVMTCGVLFRNLKRKVGMSRMDSHVNGNGVAKGKMTTT